MSPSESPDPIEVTKTYVLLALGAKEAGMGETRAALTALEQHAAEHVSSRRSIADDPDAGYTVSIREMNALDAALQPFDTPEET